MLECFKSKTGGSVYYFEGKRISKREAQNISMGKKLPSCSVKTAKNELKSLKKRIKEVMSGRETFKLSSKDLQQRLNACDIIKNKYTDLIALIESASDNVDVMNRICLTQDVKRKMDEQYNMIERSLQEYSLKNRELEDNLQTYKDQSKIMESMASSIETYKVAIDRYETEVKTLQDENKELRETIAGNEDLKTILDQLRNELSIRARDEEELRQQLIMYENKYGEAVDKYADDMEREGKYIEELELANKSLENRIEAMADLAKKLNETYKQEKERCIVEVQKAIDGEREISKKEAREFESKIADLNSKLLITEETLEELKGTGKIEDLSQIPQAKSKLKKTSKKLKKVTP